MLQINQMKVLVEDTKSLEWHVAKKLRVTEQELREVSILKRSLDARRKNQISYVYNLCVGVTDENKILAKKIKNVDVYKDKNMKMDFLDRKYETSERIAIVGFGPAGMFAALTLAQAGVNVTVFERGDKVEDRMNVIEDFKKIRKLDVESNIQFGEGGAGTYSDGKLTNHGMKPRGKWLFKQLVDAGAPEEILYVHNPHVGTDKLVDVVKNIREKIESLGSTIKFRSLVKDIKYENDKYQLYINEYEESFDRVILALGHSARDTFEMLYRNNVSLEQKPFAVGFRIEHRQKKINKSQYGKADLHKILGAAEYKLANQHNERGVYTFCMCPGGYVVPATSEEGMVVVNGMSEYKRDSENANSALLVTVSKNDFKNDHPLAGMHFQRAIERKAYELGGSNYNAPIQLLKDFRDNKISTKLGKVTPSYEIGYSFANLRSIFTEEVNQAFIKSLEKFGNRVQGFNDGDSVLSGVESRSSSPVRIIRDRLTMESLSHKKLYPIGEGAGYAGGIVSAGLDGVKVAEVILNSYDLGEK